MVRILVCLSPRSNIRERSFEWSRSSRSDRDFFVCLYFNGTLAALFVRRVVGSVGLLHGCTKRCDVRESRTRSITTSREHGGVGTNLTLTAELLTLTCIVTRDLRTHLEGVNFHAAVGAVGCVVVEPRTHLQSRRLGVLLVGDLSIGTLLAVIRTTTKTSTIIHRSCGERGWSINLGDFNVALVDTIRTLEVSDFFHGLG